MSNHDDLQTPDKPTGRKGGAAMQTETLHAMNQDYIDRFDVITRYHQNRLSDEELAGFEIYILENPGIIAQLEQEKVVREAYKEYGSLLSGDSAIGAAPLPVMSRKVMYSALSAAACMVVAVMLVIMLPSGEQDYALQAPVMLQTFRGSETRTQLSGAPVVQFQIDMGPAELLDSNDFMAELLDAQGAALFSVSSLHADSEGWLYFPLQGQQQVLSGVYEVRVYESATQRLMGAYPVEFIGP